MQESLPSVLAPAEGRLMPWSRSSPRSSVKRQLAGNATDRPILRIATRRATREDRSEAQGRSIDLETEAMIAPVNNVIDLLAGLKRALVNRLRKCLLSRSERKLTMADRPA